MISPDSKPDERIAQLIAGHVIDALRQDLRALVAPLPRIDEPGQSLSVGQVAVRLGVSRSTVYAHWREWGGYKLGNGARAAIRFDPGRLPRPRPASPAAARIEVAMKPATSRRLRRRPSELISDEPRFRQAPEGLR